MKENENLSVVHVKDDFSTEEVENNITAENNVVQNASFTASDFSIYAITTSGDLEEYTGEITSTYATIEFWDREDADNTIYLSNQKPNTGNSYKVTNIIIIIKRLSYSHNNNVTNSKVRLIFYFKYLFYHFSCS